MGYFLPLYSLNFSVMLIYCFDKFRKKKQLCTMRHNLLYINKSAHKYLKKIQLISNIRPLKIGGRVLAQHSTAKRILPSVLPQSPNLSKVNPDLPESRIQSDWPGTRLCPGKLPLLKKPVWSSTSQAPSTSTEDPVCENLWVHPLATTPALWKASKPFLDWTLDPRPKGRKVHSYVYFSKSDFSYPVNLDTPTVLHR